MSYDYIPDEMRSYDHWICWESGVRGGKKTKLPRAPWAVDHTGNVPVNDPEMWGSFSMARDWAEKMPGWGMGYVFTPSDPFVGIDLDDCYKLEDGDPVQLLPAAKDIIGRVGSYVEKSPSGTGLHLITKGELDHALKNDDRGVELYDRDRFFTVTGDEHASSSGTIDDPGDDVLDFLMEEYMVDQDEPPEDPDPLGTDNKPDVPDGEAHAMYDLTVRDVYPSLSHGDNIEHPVHGSSTGHNFKVHAHDPTAVCWRGEHQYGTKQGCVLCAWHLLAMEYGNINDCRRVRRDYQFDDDLVFYAWKGAYEHGCITGENPPWRAVQHVVREHGLADMSSGGKTAWATYRAACRIIRSVHDIPVVIDDE